MKKLILALARKVSKILPLNILAGILKKSLIGIAESGKDKEALRCLLEIDNIVYTCVSSASRNVADGVHSKHAHLKYAEFFADNLLTGERLLDVGSGLGVMCAKIAESRPMLILSVWKS